MNFLFKNSVKKIKDKYQKEAERITGFREGTVCLDALKDIEDLNERDRFFDVKFLLQHIEDLEMKISLQKYSV